MQSKKLFFYNDAGEKLAAWLDQQEDLKPRAYALLAHGFTLTKGMTAYHCIGQSGGGDCSTL